MQNLERKEKHQATQLEQLTKKQIFLKWRCEQLISYNEALCKRRSVSECSTSTISSTNSYELTRSSSSICESGALATLLFCYCMRTVSNGLLTGHGSEKNEIKRMNAARCKLFLKIRQKLCVNSCEIQKVEIG